MAETLRGGLSLGLSGFGFWSHDIGGFEQTAPAEVYKRWCAFGLLSSHSRLHGSTSYRVPWLYDEEAVDVLRHFTRLKCRLMPYLYGAAVEAHQTGTPLLRAMIMEFLDDPACDTLDRQYMLGSDLLAAPVFHAGGEVAYYLPQGTWGDLLNGNLIEGGRWVRAQHDVFSLPLLVRPNAVIPLGNNHDRPDYDYSDGVTLHLYHFEDGTERVVDIPTLGGSLAARFVVKREGSQITVSVTEGQASHWSVALHGSWRVVQVEGGAVDADQQVVIAEGDRVMIECSDA
jgi:alpha-D-xyloside xylohydrolase